MNLLFITGSARADSITTRLCYIAASVMPSSSLTVIRPHELNIQHCTGCGSCAVSGKCVIDDDMHLVYQAVGESDVIVIATPIYFSGPSSIIKQIIDRFQCVWSSDNMKGKKRTAALIAAGGQRSPVFSNTISIAKAFAATVGAGWAGELKVSNTDGMTDIPDEMVTEACSFGSKIVSKHFERT
ncbi:MAG: flavodoxin family protein [Methanomassiliicoccaceae archaeon]|nr:flavodoxin family protein [Methanomassiliicoccaceae archaeon]